MIHFGATICLGLFGLSTAVLLVAFVVTVLLESSTVS